MRLRSFFGLLFAVAVAFVASYWAKLNDGLLDERFRLGSSASIPVWGALLVVFLAGFLPVGATLVADTLRHELALRRERRRQREQESLEAVYRRAVDFESDGQFARAATELEAYLAARPDCLSGLLLYGSVLRELQRVSEAIDVHRRAATLFPLSVAVLRQLAEDYVAKGEPEVAREMRNRIWRDSPGMGLDVVRRLRAEAIDRREWAEATRLHERATELFSAGGDIQGLARESSLGQGLDYQRGVLLLERDQVAAAAEIFRRLLVHEPRFLPARIMLGEAELVAEHEESAVSIWRTGYLETGSPVFLQRIEDHFVEREEPLLAIETLRGLIAECANDLLPRFYLGRLYYRLEMLDEAARTLAGVAERIKLSPTFHYLLARIHERRRELSRAVEAYSSALRQLDVGSSEYVCRVCATRYREWQDFCHGCRTWNAVELNFEEERLSADELGIQVAPVWSVPEDSGEFTLTGVEFGEKS